MSDISLLFLTYTNILHKDAFIDLFSNCNVYIHPKYPDKVSSDLKKYIIPNLVETKWGDKSIVSATLELLKQSFKKQTNKWFILCSEDMYPLVNYSQLNDYLSKQTKSIFDVINEKEDKTSQFWALKREDVELILTNANKWDNIFARIPPKQKAADEHFFLSLLKLIKSKYEFTNKKFCYVKWYLSFLSKHPTTFNCLLPVDTISIKENNSCFIRKTYSSFKNENCPERELSILLVYGTESITDYTQFINDFKFVSNIFVLSLKDNIENKQLTSICSQSYFAMWKDAENAINVIKNEFPGKYIICSEKFDANTLKSVIENSSLSDSNGNTFESNVVVDELKEAFETSSNANTESNDATGSNNAGDILLQLGDVIEIVDPTNEILNNNVFFIEYIDPSKIKLINSETLEKTILTIDVNGVIGDGTIQSIKILSSNPEKGYARQNELLPGTWINIYFGGEIPTVITGKITNLEEDMIEIKTVDNDTLFINFNYQGIPEDLPIETFEIRPAIRTDDESEKVDVEKETGINEMFDDSEEEPVQLQEVKQRVQKMLFTLDDLEFGETINVEEYVNVDRDKYRYTIETQANDLLEEMLSNIPNAQRTSSVLNNIHTIITRFIQLREISSTFDKNRNVTGIIKRTAEYRPLTDYLSEFKNTLYWILLVARNVKKIYIEKGDETRMEDYETIIGKDSLSEMRQLFKAYKSNTITEGGNKYSTLYQSLNPYMTPFYPENPEVAQDVFNSQNGVIIEANVGSDINAIIDNLGDLYSNIVSRSSLTARKYVIQRYNLGLDKLVPDNLKGSNVITHRVKLTNNDPISINSLITLPEPAVRFSQINLPGSSLLVKANLNVHFLNYWQLLKQKTSTTPITVNSLDMELEYDDNNFVDNIKQYFLDLSEYNRPNDLTNLDIYKIFLSTIIPKTRVLFNLVKKYIKGKLSLVDVVSYLEPFMVYPIDLTYMQYREINSFIYDKIKEYNVLFKENSMAFSSIKHIKTFKSLGDNKTYYFSNPLYDVLKTLPFSLKHKYNTYLEVFESYGYFEEKFNVSGSEFLKSIITADYGSLYNTAVADSNVLLMYPDNLDKLFEADKEKIKRVIEKDKSEETSCNSFIIAKKYYSLDSLKNDNNASIYFDKEFDTTDYELVERKYKKERNQLSSEEFILFLTEEFKNKHKLSDEKAEYMATTLTNQAKKVREGDYALLIKGNSFTENKNIVEENGMPNKDYMPEGMEYYIRKDDTWVLDNDVDPNDFIKDDDILCNINYSCLYSDKEETCEPVELTKDKVIQNSLKQIIDQFDDKYNISAKQMDEKLNEQLNYYFKIFDKLQTIKRKEFLKYDEQKYKLGLISEKDQPEVIISPHAKLRDLILGQNDFVKKQQDILKFANLFCRSALKRKGTVQESEWWLYCKQTGVPLLPKFYLILAEAYITNYSNYTAILDNLKKEIGKISDDGDAWVDKHSGEIICMIDLDESEGYTDGFANKTHDVLEKDVAETIVETLKDKETKRMRLSLEGEMVSNVISVLSSNMGINIEQSRNYIVKVVTELMDDVNVIEKEPAYKKRVDELAKKGKKAPSYSSVYSSTLLYLTLGMYLIGIQTSIPSIKTRKTAPGCVRSFSGFPLEGEGDDSSVNYLACVALKSRDATTMPWNVLPKSEDKIASTVKSFIIKYLLPYGEVNMKIKEKTEYLLNNIEQEIPSEYSLTKWTTFLPPLMKFNVSHLQNISEGFRNELTDNIFTGNRAQLEKMLVVQSKIISFSLAIQECIQKIIDKKSLLLNSSSQFFMDNACCNEAYGKTLTTLQYFAQEDNSINVYNDVVHHLSSLMRDLDLLTKSAIMLSSVDTKRKSPPVSSDYSEETIYQAFIVLCKFQSSVPLSEELASVCVDKPDYLKRFDPIQEKIAKLKRDGRQYSKDKFLRLFQLVSRNNIIRMSFDDKSHSCISDLQKLLVLFDKENNETVPKKIIEGLGELVENYDVQIDEDTREMKDLKNYLQRTNATMKRELVEFIRTKGNIIGTKQSNMEKFLNELSVWSFDESTRNANIKISDDGLCNKINFMKNFIQLFSIVFPSMILTNNSTEINPPKYWGLAMDHITDIKNMVGDFYNPLNKFYGNHIIKNVLRQISVKSKGVYLLSQFTPTLTSIKIGDKEMYGVFDKYITTYLYEYYLLSVLHDYMYMSKDVAMINKDNVKPSYYDEDDPFALETDFLVEQELKFDETESEYVHGHVQQLSETVANLLYAYLTIMMTSKKTVNMSYEDIQDNVFKLKEAEKYSFTDKLRDMTDEERAVDTVMKILKIGDKYSIGASKGIREYVPEHFEFDKNVAKEVEAILNMKHKLNKKGVADDDIDDALEDAMYEAEVDNDVRGDMPPVASGYMDGDPWGDEIDWGEDDYDA